MTSFLYQPPKPERRVKTMMGQSPGRQSDRVMDHLSKGGLPVNPAILKSVKETLQNSFDETGPANIFRAIKQDPGLFAHIAKNLKHVVEEPQHGFEPFAELQTLEQEKLQKLFSISERDVSPHRLRIATPAQIQRSTQTAISAFTAESLAQRFGLSERIAFSSASMRQLGHSLLSWNYPEVYARVWSSLRSNAGNLDFELAKILGISPLQIGERLAKEWNLSTEIRWTLGNAQNRNSPLKSFSDKETGDGEQGMTLTGVCQMAELFAQANSPEHYPNAPKQWEETERTVSQVTGIRVSEVIQPRVRTFLDLLQKETHHPVATPFFAPTPSQDPLPEYARKLFLKNQQISRLTPVHRKLFEDVYKLILPEGLSVDAVRELVDLVVPKLGFPRGCLYIAQKKNPLIVPTLRIGDKPLSEYRTYREDDSNPISQSLNSSIVVKNQFLDSEGERLMMYGSLQKGPHRGVLELEVDRLKEESPDFHSLLFFQAVRNALLDCLGVRE